MTTGIYKITNKVNGKCYIGQSQHIEKRWTDHKAKSNNIKDKGYEYPLYRAFRKYGIDNFTFEIIEECKIEELIQKEFKWIQYYKPEYNQTQGNDCGYTVVSKLTDEQVNEIIEILLNDKKGIISYSEIGKKYNVHKDTIRNINLGYSWKREDLQYPIRISKYDHVNKEPIKYYCKDCGKEISKGAIDAQGNMRDLGEVIEEVANKWDTWTNAQQNAIAQAMAGKRQYNNLLALFNNWDKM